MTVFHYVLSILLTTIVMAGLAVASEYQDKKPKPTATIRLSITG